MKHLEDGRLVRGSAFRFDGWLTKKLHRVQYKRTASIIGGIKKRNHYSAEFKTQVVVEVLREEGTVNEIAARHGINPVMLSRWKVEFLERASDVFKKKPSEAEQERQHVADLKRKVGQLTYEVDLVCVSRS